MKYKIDWLEKKTTSAGKSFYKASLNDGTKQITDVAIWDGFLDFANLKAGMEVVGDLVEKQNGQYVNRSLYAPRPQNAPNGNFAPNKSAFGSGMMKAKAESIAKAQENKELGIMTSSTIRMAVECAVAENNVTPANIERWRTYFINSWEIETPKSPVDINEPPQI